MRRIDVIIPAYNEEESLPKTLRDLMIWCGIGKLRLSQFGWEIGRIIVVDNASTDETASRARQEGADVVFCATRGYGSACLSGIEALKSDPPDIVCFLDADGADDPRDLLTVLTPFDHGAVLVIGSRVALAKPGSLTSVQRFGNELSCHLLSWLFGVKYTDLGPFRAVKWDTLIALDMCDPNFGWTVEMQAKAARQQLHTSEVCVHYRPRRAGESKISGQIKGSMKAGTKILWTIGKEWIGQRLMSK